jgi:hypothetical protein
MQASSAIHTAPTPSRPITGGGTYRKISGSASAAF